MWFSFRSASSLCGATVLILSMVACSKEQPAQAQSAMPAASSAAVSPEPPPPDRNQQLKDQLSELAASQSDGGWVVSLPSARFKAGDTTFEPADTARVDRIATLLKNRPDVHVLVQAFTDSRGSTARNQQLSQQRADSVQRALIERGVEAGRVRAEGLGEEQPVADNDTAAGRERNRRVQIMFSDAEGHFASASEQPDKG